MAKYASGDLVVMFGGVDLSVQGVAFEVNEGHAALDVTGFKQYDGVYIPCQVTRRAAALNGFDDVAGTAFGAVAPGTVAELRWYPRGLGYAGECAQALVTKRKRAATVGSATGLSVDFVLSGAMSVIPPAVLPIVWYTRIYIATRTGGVYYTDDFTGPDDATQPTWTAVNSGLASLAVVQFECDPDDRERLQYCMTGTEYGGFLYGGVIYKRDSGAAWASILTVAGAVSAIVAAGYPVSTSAYLYGFAIDGGNIYVRVVSWSPGSGFLLISGDEGATWSVVYSGAMWDYGPSNAIRVRGLYVWGYGTDWIMGTIFGSNAGGAAGSWKRCYTGYYTWGSIVPRLDNPAVAFYSDISGDLASVDHSVTPLVGTKVQAGLGFLRYDKLYQDVTKQLLLKSGRLYSSSDYFATLLDASPGIIAPFVDTVICQPDNVDFIYYGALSPTFGYPHTIYCADDVLDTAPPGKAGTNCGTPPFADSIPCNSGGVSLGGVQPVG